MEPEGDRGAFGPLLRRLRLAAGISQEELAERACLSVEGISALERGRRRSPFRETVRLLADALGLSDAQGLELREAARASRPGQGVIRYDSAAPGVTAALQNYPTPATSFIGRATDLERLARLLESKRLLTITGPGGIGKTRLATELATKLNRLAAINGWFVDLAPLRDAKLVAGTIGATVGATAKSERTVESIAALIGDRPMLFTIDNCEHVIDEAAIVIAQLLQSCANLRIIATSREALHIPGESVYRLSSLTLPPELPHYTTDSLERFSSIELFYERANAIDADLVVTADNFGDMSEICRRLDGIPLAIELAAAQTQFINIRELRTMLHETFSVLTGGFRNTLPRQRTLEALLDWSYELLTDDEKLVFRRFAVFAGGWTLEAAHAVCTDGQVTEHDVQAALFSLIRKSLVVADVRSTPSRYRLLEATRAYAQAKLTQAELAQVRQRHIAWIAHFASSEDDLSWTSLKNDMQEHVSLEIDNIRLALTNSLTLGLDYKAGAAIAANLTSFYYETSKAEGRRWVESALERLGTNADTALLGRLYWAVAVLSSGKRIVTACQQAIKLLTGVEHKRDLANAYFHLGFGLWQVGNLDESLDAITLALNLLADSGFDRTGRYADMLDVRAQILFTQARFDAARLGFDESYRLGHALGDEHRMARTQGNLAELEFACNNVAIALGLVEHAAATFERLGAISRLATARINSAAYRLSLGDVNEAQEDAVEGLELAHRAQDAALVAIAIQQLATVLALRGEPANAALLIGYVDGWYQNQGYQRELNDQRAYAALILLLSEQLDDSARDALLKRGSHMNEQQAIDAANGLVRDIRGHRGRSLVGEEPTSPQS